jgi:phosphatidylserine/phosphatidylglycerophosphate/cardiolipin synthase-like enzyme
MGARKGPPEPPEELHKRKATVRSHVVNSIEVPCDPRDPNYRKWFLQEKGMQPLRKNNHVAALIDGTECFAEMMDALDTATGPAHYIYMLNWFADLDVELRPTLPPKAGAPTTKLLDVLTHAVSLGVQVRAMFWPLSGTTTVLSAKRIDRLANSKIHDANGAAVRDANHLELGSHHQKILIVQGAEGLITFCGGIDFNRDRINATKQAGSPMHDVHCQITGPAAHDLLLIFLQRWVDHPDTAKIDMRKGFLRGPKTPVPTDVGDQYVQIGRTYGNGSNHRGIRNANGDRFYSFAPKGERTAEKMIFHAIEMAERFIYVEDQYLVSKEASDKLLAQLPKIQKLIILIPHASINDHPQIWKLCKRFIDNLKGDPKVVVCYKKPFGEAPDPKSVARTSIHTYVHSKTWIVDDKFAIIGSANCGRRSYTHDSEVVAGIFDESRDQPCTLHFAHKLRIRLWAEHLALKEAEVFDPLGAAAHWFKPSISSSIAVFNQNAGKDTKHKKIGEDISEPDGS